jgi:hypothetical protein
MYKIVVAFFIGVIIGALFVGWWMHGRDRSDGPAFATPFQAVLLDNGQVYYGKVEGLGSDFPIVRDVYYVQQSQDPTTKAVTNVLIRRGQEWHGPDYTVINARHLVMVEPIGSNSKVAELIREQQSKK